MESGNLSLGIFLIAVGFLLVALEVFLPTGGILGVLSLASLGVGITFGFFHSTTAGLAMLGSVAMGIPVAINLLLWLWPRTTLGKNMMVRSAAGEDTIGSMPENLELQKLVGKAGKTLTELRPGGVVDFEGRRVDCITEGMLIEEGKWVRCVHAHGGHVVVRPAQGPPLTDLENARFMEME
ncbi:MAG: hypothetical protein EXR99_03140 [Gemmataceae bacterium]|nr:hypothetical protein [Gemmataceae bacterium]